jgi:predicted ATPase
MLAVERRGRSAARQGTRESFAAADIPALTSICFRLDGIPLALELAAARVSALSISEIADHLDDQFTLLSRAAGGPARHQTLRASVDWSHQLLTQPERVLLRRLAVFAGGLSLSAAAAQQLFIAQRTVDTHVGHILAKLDCSNRSQVAALVVTAKR